MERRMVLEPYYALLKGELRSTVMVDQPLRTRRGTSQVAVKTAVRAGPGTLPAATFFEPVLVRNGYTLARVQPHTGRKHQIRAHALWLGLPVIGDKLYGGDDSLYMEFVAHGWTKRLGAALEMGRQALHARQARIPLPAAHHAHLHRAARAGHEGVRHREDGCDGEEVEHVDPSMKLTG
jgi:23S rRNA pseudouridine1911/1915/1917 synthase